MTNENNYHHTTVLKKEAIQGLALKPGGIYIDATFGGGGHTRAILEAEPAARVIAIDWDTQAIEHNAPSLEEQFGERFKIVWGNFAQLYNILKKEKPEHIDGILADFGTSQFQIHHKAGFSFQHETPLDMRMSTAHQKLTAAEILNTFSERDIADILFIYGEELRSRPIAKAIVTQRGIQRFENTKQVADLIEHLFPRHRSDNPKIHPATKTFQALRIFVNKELENITSFLKASIAALSPGGRLVCISFHSLEDRLVKDTMKEHVQKLSIITPKPIIPSPEEIERNQSSRSAKMRIGEKLHGE